MNERVGKIKLMTETNKRRAENCVRHCQTKTFCQLTSCAKNCYSVNIVLEVETKQKAIVILSLW